MPFSPETKQLLRRGGVPLCSIRMAAVKERFSIGAGDGGGGGLLECFEFVSVCCYTFSGAKRRTINEKSRKQDLGLVLNGNLTIEIPARRAFSPAFNLICNFFIWNFGSNLVYRTLLFILFRPPAWPSHRKCVPLPRLYGVHADDRSFCERVIELTSSIENRKICYQQTLNCRARRCS